MYKKKTKEPNRAYLVMKGLISLAIIIGLGYIVFITLINEFK